MTDNEKKARELLDIALRSGMDISYGISAIYLKHDLPPLTEDECKSVALNYPISLEKLRTIFPWATMTNSKANFILLAHSDILQLITIINEKMQEGYIPVGSIARERKGALGETKYLQSMINKQ